MARVSGLFRFPLKGFTAERRDTLVVQDDGRIEGDRVLAFRFAHATEPEERDGLDYWPKSNGLALMDFPSLARLVVSYDPERRRVGIALEGRTLVEGGLDEDGRSAITAAVTDFVRSGPDGRRLEGEGVLPLSLVGDGRTSRFQDRTRGFVSLHGHASVDAVDAAATAPVDDRRFRSNIVVEGTAPWEELGWTGHVRVGEVLFEVQQTIGRCAAIQANPDTGARDARLLRLLTTEFGQEEATLGILLLPAHGGGAVCVGDEVELVG